MKLIKAKDAPSHFQQDVPVGGEVEPQPDWDDRTVTALVAAGWVEAPKPAKKK